MRTGTGPHLRPTRTRLHLWTLNFRDGRALRNAAAVLTVVALASGACSDGPRTEPRAPSATSTAPTSTAATSTLADRLEAELTIEGQPDWIVADYGSVWVALDEAAAVARIDPETTEVISTIGVGLHPCNGIAAAFDSIWVPSCTEQKLYRISVHDEAVETIDIPVFRSFAGTGPFGGPLAAGEGAVWMVTQGSDGAFDALARIDPSKNEVTDTIPLGHLGGGVAVGEGAVWVTAPEDGLLLRVDPGSREVVDQVEGLAQPAQVATGEGAVWVMSGTWPDHPDGDGSVTRVDPETGEIVARIEVDDSPGEASDIEVSEGVVWARTQYTLLVGIDPGTNVVVDRITDQKGMGGITVGWGSVWLSDFAFARVWRLRPLAP